MECAMLRCAKMFSLRLKLTVYKSFVRLGTLYWSEFVVPEKEMRILSTERSMVKAMYGV